jgi:hypothetical protein
MANEFQARYLALLTSSPYIASVAKPGRAIVDVQYYAYNGRVGTDAVPLALNVPQTSTFDTQSDSDFVLTFFSACVQETAAGAMIYNANTALQIQDLSTGKLFFNVPTALGLISGAGGFPFVFPSPRVLNPNTSIAVTATNRDTLVNGGLGPVGLFYAFHGTRIFYAS